jgi:hypothetical protein
MTHPFAPWPQTWYNLTDFQSRFTQSGGSAEENTMARKCPKCGSTRIDEAMWFYGPMVCLDCGFRVEDKTARPNPFFGAAEEETAAQESEGPEALPQSLGAALYEWSKSRRKG